MATYQEMSLRVKLFMKSYPFSRYRIDAVPCTPMRVSLSEARVALVTTAGLHTPQQKGFDQVTVGDSSFREIPNTIATQDLIESHSSNSFDHAGVKADRNLVFPLDRFRELVGRNVIGELNHRHFSFVGSILNPRKLIKETAPEVARRLRADKVDAVFLTPVWPLCNQTVGLIQAAIERENISTVSVSLLREVTKITRPPRALFAPFPLGYPLRAPNNADVQHEVIAQSLSLLIRTDVPVFEEFKETKKALAGK